MYTTIIRYYIHRSPAHAPGAARLPRPGHGREGRGHQSDRAPPSRTRKVCRLLLSAPTSGS